MSNRVYWLSRHQLSPAQAQSLRDLHGEDVEVVHEPQVFASTNGLAEYIASHADGFVYAVAGPQHYVAAALAGQPFGMFENHPGKRADGQFGLKAVHHAKDGALTQVWLNPDPESDTGEALVPVPRRG